MTLNSSVFPKVKKKRRLSLFRMNKYGLARFIFVDVLSFWATFGRKNLRGCSGYFGYKQGD
jgi:AMMECR1 domain-containing protein